MYIYYAVCCIYRCRQSDNRLADSREMAKLTRDRRSVVISARGRVYYALVTSLVDMAHARARGEQKEQVHETVRID